MFDNVIQCVTLRTTKRGSNMKQNPYTGLPHKGLNSAKGYSGNEFISYPQSHVNFYKQLWADKPLTKKFNLERLVWQYPIWPETKLRLW